MRKLLCLLLALLMLPGCGCAEGEDELYAYACSLALGLDELCSCEPYMRMYTADPEILAMIAEWAAGDHSEPQEAYMMTLDAVPGWFEQMVGTDVQLPELAIKQLRNRVLATIPTQVNATLGSRTLAATTMCQYGISYSAEGTNTLYYLRYAEGADVVVIFTPSGDGIMGGTATFLATEFPQEVWNQLGFVRLK